MFAQFLIKKGRLKVWLSGDFLPPYCVLLHVTRNVILLHKFAEAVFLVIFGASSFPARHEVYGENIKEFVPSQKRARSQLVSNLTKNTVSGLSASLL